MGKRGLQSKDAMGIDAYEMMDQQLGHNQNKSKFIPSVNKAAQSAPAAPAVVSQPAIVAAAAPPRVLSSAEYQKELKDLMGMAENGLNSRFSDMFKAFQYVDLDRSGRLSKKEIARALDMWNVPMDDAKLDMLMKECDADGDGGISYEEFVDKLARETVAPAAMGKRGLQSKDAMGIDAYEMMDQQLGHNQNKSKFIPTVNC